ncbi:unnamed protein product [Nyctereutes procyonoides]|uniref:(raccoon dog) hypothetical protein n=1 Tax=Nyctereutes procyonoides TaxID=34880 RepID=A0A811Y6I7_NYCPR|nr:unnamed protein product [Nyctereutes procyonoides]
MTVSLLLRQGRSGALKTIPPEVPAQAEPFDNTTYRNIQHHDYTLHTFLDLNLDLTKDWMPQPSLCRVTLPLSAPLRK